MESLSSISFKYGFNEDINKEFFFKKPEEAPVFRPSFEDFNKGPLEYIKKIRPYAERYGICKIIPPSEFKPIFKVDSQKFAFKPRVQRINELEALTRTKLCFFEKIIKYWNLQGASIKIPIIERKIVDLYLLHKTVSEEGGFETCIREKKWMKIASKLYSNAGSKSAAGSLLRQHYERLLYPYDIFVSGASTGQKINDNNQLDTNNNKMEAEKINIKIEFERKECCVPHHQDNLNINLSNSNKRNIEDECESLSPNLKKGKIVRTMARRSSSRISGMTSIPITSSSSFTNMMISNNAINSKKDLGLLQDTNSSKIICKLCGLSKEMDKTRKLLECDACKNNYHLTCLIIPLNNYPKGKWNCPQCVADLVPKLPKPYTHEFGFAESRCKYTLSEFGEIANKFKCEYFNKSNCEDVSLDLCEKEFWRLVTCIDDVVTVEYGADLHTNQVGSGFATVDSGFTNDNKYVDHPWNLNNLPLLEGSLFKYINSNINGMIVPWIYVGMCFSTFCWHNEDHWTYSINYLHWGEAKTWYGVPGDSAELFEEAMAKTAPELFEAQPDLLHQLVTICNPNILQSRNVPIYRTNQEAGEFVVTFPRSYHAGFNQGFNLAEAVNFAPLDWLPIGRLCMDNYTKLRRYPVFSHDELICNMGTYKNLSAFLLNHVYDDMLIMVKLERNNRKKALDYGITKSIKIQFNTLPDDERQCDHCRTTCYLSALTCSCDTNKLVCLPHMRDLCKVCLPSDFILKYTFKLDELVTILKHLEQQLELYENWSSQIRKVLSILSVAEIESETDLNETEIVKLIELRDLADHLCVPKNSKVYIKLNEHIETVQTITKKVKDIINKSRFKNNLKDEDKITFDEFKHLITEINNLNVQIDQQDKLKQLFNETQKLINELEDISKQTRQLENKGLINKLNNLDSKFNFLNLNEFFGEISDKCLANNRNKSKSKKKYVNTRLNQHLSPPIRNMC